MILFWDRLSRFGRRHWVWLVGLLESERDSESERENERDHWRGHYFLIQNLAIPTYPAGYYDTGQCHGHTCSLRPQVSRQSLNMQLFSPHQNPLGQKLKQLVHQPARKITKAAVQSIRLPPHIFRFGRQLIWRMDVYVEQISKGPALGRLISREGCKVSSIREKVVCKSLG